jgi:signal transduction histidine kinase
VVTQAPPAQMIVCHRRPLCDCGCAESIAARDEFIGVLGHELRNTIAPMVLLTDHFEQLKLNDPHLAGRVAMLTRNLRKLSTTIDRITEVSTLRDGKLELDIKLVDLRDVVDDVAREFAEDARRAGTSIRVTYTSSVQGWWDRARLKQLLGNLVGNAIRYGDGAEVEVSTVLRDTHAELVVHDLGPGIPLEQHEQLFDRFDHRCVTRGNGFGVGLFVVKALCQAMGGSVELDPNAPGARFCITLPRG